MTVNDKAVEAAARVGINNYSDAHPNCDPKLARWEDYDKDDRAEVLRQVREELEAAAPFIAAQALSALAYNTFGPGEVRDEILRVVKDVHGVRADEMEAGGA